jgi:hypothetical protein
MSAAIYDYVPHHRTKAKLEGLVPGPVKAPSGSDRGARTDEVDKRRSLSFHLNLGSLLEDEVGRLLCDGAELVDEGA